VLRGIVGNINMGLFFILTECEQISEWNRDYCVIKHNILFKAIGLSPGGNGYLTQIQKHEIGLLLD
jgi:hypothetical protein